MYEKTIPCYCVSRELELMLRLALLLPVEQIPEDIDWERFRKVMKKHRIYPLVIRGLRRLPAQMLEAYPVLREYRSRQNYYVNENLKLIRVLAYVARAFAEAGIDMISMKGPLLSMELYGDPAMRTSHDLDIMVSPEDFWRGCKCLMDLGFEIIEEPELTTEKRVRAYMRVSPNNHCVFRLDNVLVELHWRTTLKDGISFRDLWENRDTKLLLGVPVSQMGAADKLPHLIDHAADHAFMRLRWLLDLYEFQRKKLADWDRVLEDMGRIGNRTLLPEALLVMLRLQVLPMEQICVGSMRAWREGDQVRVCCGEDLRVDVETAVELSSLAWPMMDRDLDRDAPEFQAYLKQMPVMESEKPAMERIWNRFWPNVEDFAWFDLPDWLFWVYFIIRPFNWLRRKLFGGKE